MRSALITGVTGQDGSYLAELLVSKGYRVHGTVRRSSSINTARIDHLYEADQIKLHYADVTDPGCLSRLVREIAPDECYNLAAQSHVKVSFDQPAYTGQTVGMGALHLLEAVRDAEQHLGKQIHYYQASSSEMFGNAPPPQNESTPFKPRSPYAAAKVYAHHLTVNYRESYGMHASCGILFNHESPRRGETFVTRKIARGAARIAAGRQDCLYLGNLDARRDWGFAGDYVEAMWLMLQQDEPDDYVIATGEAYSVRQFCAAAFAYVGLDWQSHVAVDSRYFRPAEVDVLQGDASKARKVLGWEPKVAFDELVRLMVDAEYIEPEPEPDEPDLHPCDCEWDYGCCPKCAYGYLQAKEGRRDNE